MKIVRVIVSCASIFLGVIIITLSKLVEEFSVILGRAAFQAAAAGSYEPQNYEVNVAINYWLGTLCIIVGMIVLGAAFINNYIKNVLNT